MRGVFNTSCDLFQGADALLPFSLIGTFPCRLVTADAIFLVGQDSPTRFGYLTIQGTSPRGAWVPPEVSTNIGIADLVAIPSGSSPQFQVLFTESVLWQAQPLYFRANLIYMIGDTSMVGEIRYVAFDSLPIGWKDCDGEAINRLTYSILFGLIGTTWGPGDGITTFNLPDLRGRTSIGKSPGALPFGRPTIRTVGQSGGDETNILGKQEMPDHHHSQLSTDVVSLPAGMPYIAGGIALGGDVVSNTNNTGNTGAGLPHNNMPPYAVMRAIIKT